LDGHRGRVVSLSFAADGRSLVSGSTDGTALVWDMIVRPEKLPVRPLSAPELDVYWNDLASADATRARLAMGRLAAAPEQSVPYLRTRLRPVQPVDARLLTKLIADLDRDDFAVRERASGELSKLGESVELMLQRAFEAPSSTEVKSRAQAILERLERS